MAIHSDPNLLVLWFTIGPSNKEHKWSGIKDVHEGEDVVLTDSSSLQRAGGHSSPPVVKDLPGGKSLGARLIICNILWEVATSFLRGLSPTAGNSLLYCAALLRSSVSSCVIRLPRCHHCLVTEQSSCLG